MSNSDDVIDPGTFWIHAPVWVVAPAANVLTDEDGRPILAEEGRVGRIRTRGEGRVAVAVFTDRDLAQRHAALAGGLAVATFRSRLYFAAFLRRAKARGRAWVCFDPNVGATLVSVDAVIGVAGRKMGGQ